MNRVNVREQILNFVLLLLVQLPLVHRITFFDKAFGFFYVGFILLLPSTLSRTYLMLIGFLSGLAVDIFSSTPGIHASACVLIMFLRNFWLNIIDDDWKELTNLNIVSLRKIGFVLYLLPLVFIHHVIIFLVENGGFHLFNLTLSKVFFSTIFSTFIIVVINFLITSNRRRR